LVQLHRGQALPSILGRAGTDVCELNAQLVVLGVPKTLREFPRCRRVGKLSLGWSVGGDTVLGDGRCGWRFAGGLDG